MCVVEGGTFKGLPPGRKNAQPGMAVPRTQHFVLAKIFGVPLGLAWRKFRLSCSSGTQYLRMCVVEAVGNNQGASTRAEKRTARNGTYPALRAGLKSSASLWDLRGENSDRV